MRYIKMSVLANKLNARGGEQISKNLVNYWFSTLGYDVNPEQAEDNKIQITTKEKKNNEQQ